MRPCSFFIFPLSSSLLPPRRNFLRVHPSSSSILPPRPSFLLVPPSSTSLFLPRPALSKSFRIRKRPVFIDLDESVTDGPADRRTDKASYRDARTHLKREQKNKNKRSKKQKRFDSPPPMRSFFTFATWRRSRSL